MVTTESVIAAPGERWVTATNRPLQILALRLRERSVALSWRGRARPNWLERFVINSADEEFRIRAIGWTGEAMIQTDPFRTKVELDIALSEATSGSYLTFLRLERLAPFQKHAAPSVTAWSRLDIDEWSDEGSSDPIEDADVGVTLPLETINRFEPALIEFIKVSYFKRVTPEVIAPTLHSLMSSISE